MTWKIELHTIQGVKHVMDMQAGCTILDVKDKVAEELHIPAECQKFITDSSIEILLDTQVLDVSLIPLTLIVSDEAICLKLENGSSLDKSNAISVLKKLSHYCRGSDRAIAALIAEVEQGRVVKQAAVKALALLVEKGDERVVTALASQLDNQSYTARKEALEDLKLVADKGNLCAITAAFNHLEDQDTEVRQAAMELLTQVANDADEFVVTTLAAKLDHRDWRVLTPIVESLVKVALKGDGRVIAGLSNRLEDKNENIRALALQGLSRAAHKGDKSVSTALVGCLEDEYAIVRTTAVRALAKVAQEEERVIVALSARLDDEDTEVRHAAAHALFELAEQRDARSESATEIRSRGNDALQQEPLILDFLEGVWSRGSALSQ